MSPQTFPTPWRAVAAISRCNVIPLQQDKLAAKAPARPPIFLGGTLARFRSGLHPAHLGPRWQAVVGPVVAGLGILLLVGWALFV
jgi:hypothetical protein